MHLDRQDSSSGSIAVAVPWCAIHSQELLVATRHVLATDFKRGFFAKLDILLEEK